MIKNYYYYKADVDDMAKIIITAFQILINYVAGVIIIDDK